MKKIFIISSLIATTLATPSFATPTELDKKTVASKAYVDTKQDKITTGLVVFEDGAVQGGTSGEDDLTVRALVATNAAGTTLTGNTIGILDANTLNASDEGRLSGYAGYGAEMDNFVPTVRVVTDAIGDIWSNMPSSWTSLDWSNTQSAAINAYNTTFGNGTNQWAGVDYHLINGYFLANSLALKQNKIPAGTAGNVVTYSGTAGTVGSVATANAPTYNETTGVLENGTNIATIAAVDTRQKKMTCAGWDSETHTDEHCWLWSIE